MTTKTTISPEQAAINAALAAAYMQQAKKIAQGKSAIDKAQEKIEAAKGGQWQAFKDAGRHGLELGHDADTMSKGVTLACAELKVPQGTVNAYLPLVRKMYAAVVEGGEDAAAIFGMSVKQARERFQPAKPKQTKTAAPATPAAPSADETGEDAGDDNGMMGGSPRSRMLSQIGAIIASMSDDDLAALLAQLTGEEAQEANAA